MAMDAQSEVSNLNVTLSVEKHCDLSRTTIITGVVVARDAITPALAGEIIKQDTVGIVELKAYKTAPWIG